MSIVYLLYSRDYTEFSVHGIYTSREALLAGCNELARQHVSQDSFAMQVTHEEMPTQTTATPEIVRHTERMEYFLRVQGEIKTIMDDHNIIIQESEMYDITVFTLIEPLYKRYKHWLLCLLEVETDVPMTKDL